MVEIWNTWTERVMDVESVNTFKQCLKINLNAYLKSCDLLESGMKLGRAFDMDTVDQMCYKSLYDSD